MVEAAGCLVVKLAHPTGDSRAASRAAVPGQTPRQGHQSLCMRVRAMK